MDARTPGRVGERVAITSSCDRRAALRCVALGLTAALSGCATDDRATPVTARGTDGDDHVRGRLTYRAGDVATPGRHARRGSFAMDVGGSRPAALHVPDVDGPLRLVVLLHGSGGEPERTRRLLLPYAESERLLLLAPASSGPTWDVIQGGSGPDVLTIDALLRRTAEDFVVDGMTVAGFSDGASYALTLGVCNGDVFDSVIAFSPGFAAAQERHGDARFFVSHGTGDQVLPIERCSRRLVPALQAQGYEVTYEEFDGGHEVPTDVRDAAVTWLR